VALADAEANREAFDAGAIEGAEVASMLELPGASSGRQRRHGR
jgi:hypothetical protein